MDSMNLHSLNWGQEPADPGRRFHLFHSWKIPQRGQVSWSGAHRGQGHKKPTGQGQMFTIRHVCLLRQHSPVSGNLPSGAVVWGLKNWLAHLNCWPVSLGVQNWPGNEVIVVFSASDVPGQTLLHLSTARWPCPSTPMSGHCPEKQHVSAAHSLVGAGPSHKRQGIICQSNAPSAGEVRKSKRVEAGSEFCPCAALHTRTWVHHPGHFFMGLATKSRASTSVNISSYAE